MGFSSGTENLVYQPGYADFYLNSQYGIFPQEHRSLAGASLLNMIMVDQQRHDFSDPAVSELIVSFPVVSAPCSYAWDMGFGWSSVRSQAGDLIVVPPHTESRWRVSGARRLLVFAIPVEIVRKVLGPECPADLTSAFETISGSSRPDALTQQVMLKLWEMGRGEEPPSRIMAESVLTTLVCQVLSLSQGAAETAGSGAMPPRNMKRLIEYVDAHLHEDIGLAELAEIAGWGVRHFARVFQQTMGQTPHRWVMDRRVSRAKYLLTQREMSLAEIALTCGFADQSHFTTCFRRSTGFTPLRWRNGGFSGA